MAPYNIPFVDRLLEIRNRKSRLEDNITMQEDLINMLQDQIEEVRFELGNIPLRLALVRRDSNEHRQLRRLETKLRSNCEYAESEIEKLKDTIAELRRSVNDLQNEIDLI